MEGTIKWYKKDKGYGFITSEGKDYFVHYTALPESADDSIKEQKVTFDVEATERGDQAINVKFSEEDGEQEDNQEE